MTTVNNIPATDFTYTFESSQPTKKIFETLLDVRKWWYGIFDETITGKSKNVNDTFTFLAGGGMHETTQKLIELIPDTKIVWLVTASNLSFVDTTDEWTHTKFGFELSKSGVKTKITFTHEGLQAEVLCFDACSNGWVQYLKQLEKTLN